MDFSTAFEKINYKLPITKLHANELNRNAHNSILTYFQERK